jgi:hypothetical protein
MERTTTLGPPNNPRRDLQNEITNGNIHFTITTAGKEEEEEGINNRTKL